jgi:adenylate kinase
VDDEVLVSRIVGRAEAAAAAGQPVRADDNEDALRVRLAAYYKQTSPLIGYYYAKGGLKSVDGLASMDDVAKSIADILG